MPNGDSYHSIPSIKEQIDTLTQSERSHKMALWQAIAIIKQLIQDDKDMRRLAQLPEREYPKDIYDKETNMHWPIIL